MLSIFSKRKTISKSAFSRELLCWSILGLALSAVEGSVIGVLVKNTFQGLVSDSVLYQAVAIVTGAPAFANILSFVWASLSHGRNKINFLVVLLSGFSLCLLLVAFAPLNGLGLYMMATGVVCARIMWAGVVTLRSFVWRFNYPRNIRAKITAKLSTAVSLVMAACSISIGWFMDKDPEVFRTLYIAFSILGTIAALLYLKMPLRGHKSLMASEQQSRSSTGGANWTNMLAILKTDIKFRRYMINMFIFGSGNLMFMAPLIIMLSERLALSQLQQMLLTSAIPFIMVPLSVGLWAIFLDKVHIIQYRAIHSWSFFFAILTYFMGLHFNSLLIMYFGATLFGIAISGAVLAWNLGHNDFANQDNSGLYMGVHVSLTGLRGLIAPILGVNLYYLIENLVPGSGYIVLLLPVCLSLIGAIGFVYMYRQGLN